MKTQKHPLNLAAQNRTNHAIDREKELKDLVTLLSQEIGFLLGVLQGELAYLKNAMSLKTTPHSITESQDIAERILLLTKNLKVFSYSTLTTAEKSDLSQILLESVDTVEKVLQKRDLRLTVMVETGSYCTVDSGIFHTAFTNLVLFAAHFLPSGSELQISLKHTKKEILIELKDDVTPINSSEHLFEPHALREQFPSLSHLCIAPSVAKFALLHHGGNIEITPSKEGTAYLMSMPFEAKHNPTLSYPHQRKAKRIQSNLLCEMTGDLESVGTGVVSVLSTLGAYIKLPKDKVGDRLSIHQEIAFNIHLFSGIRFSVTRAKIVSLFPGTVDCGMGLEFIEVEPKGKVLLEEIIRCNIV